MRLKDFQFTFGYVVDKKNVELIMKNTGCNQDEATSQDYEMNCKWQRWEFDNQTRCIASLFSRLLKYVNTEDTRKIIIWCTPKVQDKKIVTFDGFCEVYISFDYNSFVSLDDLDKKKMTLEKLLEAIRIVAADKNWDMEPFERVYTKIIEAGYKNEWVWGKPLKSPDKKAVARVFLQHEVKQIDISIIISGKDGREIVREKVVSEKPNEFIYFQHLGEFKWLDNNKVVLVNIIDNDKKFIVGF